MAIKIFLDELQNEQLHLEGELTPAELELALGEGEALMQPDGPLVVASQEYVWRLYLYLSYHYPSFSYLRNTFHLKN